jgi:hypothetical protein
MMATSSPLSLQITSRTPSGGNGGMGGRAGGRVMAVSARGEGVRAAREGAQKREVPTDVDAAHEPAVVPVVEANKLVAGAARADERAAVQALYGVLDLDLQALLEVLEDLDLRARAFAARSPRRGAVGAALAAGARRGGARRAPAPRGRAVCKRRAPACRRGTGARDEAWSAPSCALAVRGRGGPARRARTLLPASRTANSLLSALQANSIALPKLLLRHASAV